MRYQGISICCFCLLVPLLRFVIPQAFAQVQMEAAPEDRPLPDLNVFLNRIKENLKSDRLLLSQYTYNMKTTTQYLDREDRVKETEIKEYEVFPSLDEDMTYQKLISENGRPVEAEKLEKQDRDYKKKADARARKLSDQNQTGQEERRAKEAEENRKERETIDDMLQLYQFSLLRREIVDGHSAIWIEFTPKPQYRPKTKDGNILKKVKGRALISEMDYQVMRADVELIDDFTMGLGLLARVHQGAKLEFIRQKINNEIWLPAEFNFAGSARVLLLKKIRVRSTSVFWNYKKYSVSSTYEFLTEKPPQ